jgi:RNA polymerase sigma factor (sigma-70 family)
MKEPKGFRAFVSEETPGLFREALLLSHHWELADHLVEETVSEVLAKWRAVRRAESPSTYAHAILSKKFLSMAHLENPAQPSPGIIIPPGVPTWQGLTEEIELSRLLASLSPEERVVVVGRYAERWSSADLAKIMGCDEGRVRLTERRALAKLDAARSAYRARRGIK